MAKRQKTTIIHHYNNSSMHDCTRVHIHDISVQLLSAIIIITVTIYSYNYKLQFNNSNMHTIYIDEYKYTMP